MPLACLLAFKYDLGVFGLQYGINTAIVLQFILNSWTLSQTSWAQVMVEAQERSSSGDGLDTKSEDTRATEGHIELACTDMEYSTNCDGTTREITQ